MQARILHELYMTDVKMECKEELTSVVLLMHQLVRYHTGVNVTMQILSPKIKAAVCEVGGCAAQYAAVNPEPPCSSQHDLKKGERLWRSPFRS